MDIFMIVFMILAILISDDSEHQILEIVRSKEKHSASSLCRKHGMKRAVLNENDVMELIAIARKHKLEKIVFFMKKDNLPSPYLLGGDNVYEPIPHSYEGNTGLCVPKEAENILFIYKPMKKKFDFDKWFGRTNAIINFILLTLSIIRIIKKRKKDKSKKYKKKVKKYKKIIKKYKKIIKKYKKKVKKYKKKVKKYKKIIKKYKKIIKKYKKKVKKYKKDLEEAVRKK